MQNSRMRKYLRQDLENPRKSQKRAKSASSLFQMYRFVIKVLGAFSHYTNERSLRPATLAFTKFSKSQSFFPRAIAMPPISSSLFLPLEVLINLT